MRTNESHLDLYVITSHGRKELYYDQSDPNILSILNRNDVPWSAVSIYGLKGDKMELLSVLDKNVHELKEYDALHIYFNRNVNPYKFSVNNFATFETENNDFASTEYLYQVINNVKSESNTFLKKLSINDCKDIIFERVKETIMSTIPEGNKVVVGISGGGDSNAMLNALVRLSKEYDIEVYPAILKGIPDWDSGVERTKKMAADYELELRVIEEEEVKKLLDIKPQTSLVDAFEKEFPDDDFEFLGTLLIRLALSEYARSLNTPYIMTGVNLEDILCEQMYNISNGHFPTRFPKREMGDITLVYPLWLCPKKIIDGCFPKYSLENYDMRYPCFSLGRNYYYSIIYHLQSTYPSLCEKLAHGLSSIAEREEAQYNYDEDLGFLTLSDVDNQLKKKFLNMRS